VILPSDAVSSALLPMPRLQITVVSDSPSIHDLPDQVPQRIPRNSVSPLLWLFSRYESSKRMETLKSESLKSYVMFQPTLPYFRLS